MAIEQTSISPQFIISGLDANKGTGSFKGQIYYSTDTNLNYYWDGTAWIETSVDLTNLYKLIGNNALNILDLTAQASLTAGINANFERDIYTDANGYLNTIDTGAETNGRFDTDHYSNELEESVESGDGFTNTTGTFTSPLLVKTFNTTLYSSKVHTLSEFYNPKNDRTINYKVYVKYYYDDTTTHQTTNLTGSAGPLQNCSIEGDHINPNPEKLLTKIEVWATSSETSYNRLVSGTYTQYNYIVEDAVIQTNKQDLELTPTNFMIVSNEETTGTGSVTYDISFDNGANYQTNLTSFTEYSVVDSGTELILKQNLNAGASEGIASAYNRGVLLW